MKKIIECVKKELVEELLTYITTEHEKALEEERKNPDLYQRGKAYAYGDIRLILSSWVKLDDPSYIQFITNFVEM